MNDELADLKSRILDGLITLEDESAINASERFSIIMARYIENGDLGLLNRAYEVASKLDDPSLKSNALLQLLDEVNIAQNEQADAGDAGTVVTPKEIRDTEADLRAEDNSNEAQVHITQQ